MLQHTITTLQSGLTIIRIPMASVESATFLALANTGSRYEKPDQYGIAHFFEHMVFKGTAKYPTAQELARTVDGIGANFNAFTGKEYTGYYVQAASQHLPLAVSVVAEMLMRPMLRQEDIDREKGVIVEELNMYVDNPAHHIADVFEEVMYGGTGLEHNIVGTKETIKAMQREHFVQFLKEWYGYGNLVVIVAGEAKVVNSPALLEQIEQEFAEAGEGLSERTPTKINVTSHLHDSPYASEKTRIVERGTEQVHFVLGWPGVKRDDKDRFALSLLSTVLGGNMSSRLFTEVREKRGLCYYVHSDLDQYHDGGVFGASAGVDVNRVEEAIKVVTEEFSKLITGGANKITSEELQHAKEYVAGKMVLGLEDSHSVAQFYGMKQILLHRIETPEWILEQLRAVTVDQVQAAAERLIKPDQRRLAVIGKVKAEQVAA